ncbi:hypothetical protein ELQ87_11675 [Streptomyces griseoviridis]|uniref:Uncharacterized protein n=1 Tax=Streptomyces griseoviridis TaxID=45398 RepID=A0A3Q9KN79_STRGD|nr:hypothetical protein ELQ87_11675 [Streptomyces griseoviridis]QCN88277.1 hypothetical protein DDJ31_27630 [Streptomyces griseoviridis]
MHAAGLYLPAVSHSMNARSPAVSPVNAQGTSDVEESGRGWGQGKPREPEKPRASGRQERRDAEASLADLTE